MIEGSLGNGSEFYDASKSILGFEREGGWDGGDWEVEEGEKGGERDWRNIL